MPPIQYRKAIASDIPLLTEFNICLALESQQLKLDPAITRKGVESVIHDGEKGFYLLAENANTTLASLLITREWSDWRNGFFWWLQSVYVREGYRRQGVFTTMMQEIRKLAAAAPGVIGIRLYVDQDNQPALKTYLKSGFTKSSYLIMELGHKP